MSVNQPPPPPPPPPGGPGAPPPSGGAGMGHQPAAPGLPRPAELLQRFLARLIDFVLLAVVFAVVSTVLSSIVLAGLVHSFGELFVFWTLMSVLQAVAYVAYFALMEANLGQTVGKMVLKLRTVGPDGVSRPTLDQAVRRNAFAGLTILGIVPVVGWYFLGWAAPLAAAVFLAITLHNDQPDHRGWHDRFAGGTKVLQVG